MPDSLKEACLYKSIIVIVYFCFLFPGESFAEKLKVMLFFSLHNLFI